MVGLGLGLGSLGSVRGVGDETVPSSGTLLEGFESFTGFTHNVSPNPTVSFDATIAVQGTYAMRLDTASALGGFDVYKTRTSFDATTLGAMAIRYAFDDDWDWQCNNSPQVAWRVNGTGTLYPIISRSSASRGADGLYGKRWLFGALSQANAAVAAGGVGNHRDYYRGGWTGAKVGSNALDAMYYGIGGKAGIIPSFDDAIEDAYTVAFPVMAPLGIVGDLSIPTGLVGGSGRYTWANVATMVGAGWAASLDGTPDSSLMTDAASVSAAMAVLDAMNDDLVSRGFPRSRSFVYPNGTKRTVFTTVTKTGTPDGNATTRLIPLADTSGISVGMRVVCYGASRTVRVEAVNTNVSVKTTEAIPTVSNLLIDFIDDSDAFHGNKLQTALKAGGYRFGRTTTSGALFAKFGVAPDDAIEMPGNSSTGMTLATFQTLVNTAIANKTVVNLYIHNLKDTGLLAWAPGEFASCMAWLKTQIDAGLIESLTTKTLEARYWNARVPAP